MYFESQKNNVGEQYTKTTSNVEFASWPQFGEEEIDAVSRVLRSGKVNYWTGEECKAFEREFADFIGVNHAISVANGTVALELALISLGIGAGDEVVVPSRTFVATGSAVLRCGATPVFADIDLVSQNLTADTIMDALTEQTKAVIVVHLAGWPCDMDPIMALAEQRGLKVVEDCAQAHGAVYKGRQVGSIGHAAAFSFCQDKIMSTGGEGGMLTTGSEDVWRRAWAFKDHGKDYDSVHHQQHRPGFRWLHSSLGTNWRMTEMQAAIGRVCLRKLPSWVAARRSNAKVLSDGLREVAGIRTTEPPADVVHAYYKYYMFVSDEQLLPAIGRDQILEAVMAEGIPCFSGSCSEIYLEKTFTEPGLNPPGRLPVAKEIGETSLMLLVHPTLTIKDMTLFINAVRQVMQRFAVFSNKLVVH